VGGFSEGFVDFREHAAEAIRGVQQSRNERDEDEGADVQME
jgi:hypothetical protein